MSVTDTKSYSSSYGNANSQLLLLDITTNIMKNKTFNNLFQFLWDKQKLNRRKSRNNCCEHPEHDTSVVTQIGSNDLVVNSQSKIHPC
ncbi:hypothetical protein DPMN_037253 [Dreissena polymorpha]|uniref:Uncharacterized protein n=1 Tax=Dreissena polymorpha TaxID=45954 RepID=A0A9D4MAL3_DREPO|nr:hypothetical protein DPMN_158627 [Dreissena polymorpha]KAH3874012.1 hypothetical protein DPMN_037253 [Dreissena polymorpha]